MNAAHRRIRGAEAIARDLSKPNGAPRHSTATHVHDFIIVAVFEGLRESIAQCACGETQTVFAVAS